MIFRTDSDALWIEVTSSMEGEIKMIFCAVLCGNEAAELLVKSSNCVNLPVLLTAGNQVSVLGLARQGSAMS